MAILLALLSALCYGISDFGAGVASRRSHAGLVSPILLVIGLACSGVMVAIDPGIGPRGGALAWGAASGLGGQKTAFFLREIGKGLSYLHECGIVHRDLKPGNIFYENGYVKIGDYGLSKAITAGVHSGQTITVGTVHYMAPEVGAGSYDRSIDIYALGILIYEMLTGQVPFFGASPAEGVSEVIISPPPGE